MRRSLTDTQRQQIADAARTLSVASRLAFLADVECALEARCGSYITISNDDVQQAINCVLDAAPWPKNIFLCDSQPKELQMPKKTFTDADARQFELDSASAMHRPGFRYGPDAFSRDAYVISAADRDAEDAEAWKGSPPTGAASQEPRETRSVGDRCLVQGRDGHLYEADDGSLVCVPDEWGDAALSEAAIEHARYLDHLTSAWKGGKP